VFRHSSSCGGRARRQLRPRSVFIAIAPRVFLIHLVIMWMTSAAKVDDSVSIADVTRTTVALVHRCFFLAAEKANEAGIKAKQLAQDARDCLTGQMLGHETNRVLLAMKLHVL
jgi:hypothetical protein